MEEICEKPSSIILYRQTSLETVPGSGKSSDVDSCEHRAPIVVDMKLKMNKQLNEGKILYSIPTKRVNEKIKPPVPVRQQKEVRMSQKDDVIELNFVRELEKKLSMESRIPEDYPQYLDMTCANPQNTQQNLDISNNNPISERTQRLEFSPDMNQNDPSYCEMELIQSNSSLSNDKHQTVNQKNESETDYANCQSDERNIYETPTIKIDEGNKAVSILPLMKAASTIPTLSRRREVITNSHQQEEMATLRPKSPISKTENESSIWNKIGTLGRKKRIKEVQEVQEEGKYAIDSPGFMVTPVISPEDYDLDENEERSAIMPKAFEDPKLRELIQVLIDWINDELASQRIIVQDLTEDLYDGQVLQKLFEMLTGHKLDVPEVTQSEEGQKQKLSVILSHFNRVLGLPLNHNKWNVEVIHSKSILPILHLLVALARHFRPPVRLPEHVSVSVTVVQKSQGQLNHRIVREVITSEYSDVGMRCERDAFDTLFDHAPDKLQVVKKSMVTFVNKHLNKLNLEVTEIETQFHDGVYLIMLMGLLEGFFVPLYSFFPTPKDNDQKVHNVSFAFELMEEVGLTRPKARPEDVVNLDLKSTLRVLYNLFNKYKSLL